MKQSTCRLCGTPLSNSFVNLGLSPLANSYVQKENSHRGEVFFPLHAYVCGNCYLVQLEEYESPENIFSEYAYFSSYSNSWLDHAQSYASEACERFGLSHASQIIEIASNDGYLLQYFKKYGVPVLGIEPARNVAEIARGKGIPTVTEFFGAKYAIQLAKEYKADLLIANNVLAHVPNLNDFVVGMKKILKPQGVISVEFPHLQRLIEDNQFDTIYHEHFSYFSFFVICRLFADHGLEVFDVKELPTHGGSLRVYVKHAEDNTWHVSPSVSALLVQEELSGLKEMLTYQAFGSRVVNVKRQILEFFFNVKEEGKTIVGYGAPAKGNTLLNYCGIKTDYLDYTVDRNPHKQGLYLPGSRILIKHPDMIKVTKPDYVLILPWNLTDEILDQMSYVREWGGRFVVIIPEIKVI